MVIAANADNVFRRLCEAMGRPELADDPRFATHLARGDNQDEIEGIVADWAAQHDADGDRQRPQRGRASSAGRSTRSPTSSRTRSSRRARCCVEHVDPEFGAVHRAGDRAEAVEHARGPCAGRRRGRRAATTTEVYGGLLGLSDDELGDAARGRRAVSGPSRSATSAPRDGLQNDAGRPRAGRPRRARRPARRGRGAADRGGQLRQPRARAPDGGRRGGRRRRSSGATASSTRASSLNERGYDRLRDDGPRRGALRLRRRPRRSTSATRAPPSTTRSRPRRASSSARTRTASARPSRSARRSAAPSRGAVDPGRVLELAAQLVDGRRRRDRVRRHDRRRRAAPGATTSSARRSRSAFPSACTCTTRATPGIANAFAAVEAGATVLDASVGGIGGCPFAPRATGNIATEDLVYLLHGEGDRDGHRPRRADRGGGVARRACSGGSSRDRSTGPATFAPVAG